MKNRLIGLIKLVFMISFHRYAYWSKLPKTISLSLFLFQQLVVYLTNLHIVLCQLEKLQITRLIDRITF